MHKRRRNISDDDQHYETKTTKSDQDVVSNMENVIYRIGYKSLKDINTHIQELSQIVLNDITQYDQEILRILMNCAQQIPERMTIYTTLIGVINSKNSEFCARFVSKLVVNFRNAFKENQFDDQKYLLRFISDLANCSVINPHSLLQLYHNLLDCCRSGGGEEEQRGSSNPQTLSLKSDWILYLVLYCLPYSGKTLYEARTIKSEAGEAEEDANEDEEGLSLTCLMAKIQNYMTRRPREHLSMFQVWCCQSWVKWPDQEDYLECLWAQVRGQQKRRQTWVERALWRPYWNETFGPMLSSNSSGRLHDLEVPRLCNTNAANSSNDATVIYPMPRAVFRLFVDEDTEVLAETVKQEGGGAALDGASNSNETAASANMANSSSRLAQAVLPKHHAIERFLVQEQYRIIIECLKFDKDNCAKELLELPVAAHLHVHYLLTEHMLGELLQLPRPTHSALQLGALFVALCRRDASHMALVLAQASDMLFERLDFMKPACIERFAVWFAYNLSQYDFKWSWEDWVEWSELLEEEQRAATAAPPPAITSLSSLKKRDTTGDTSEDTVEDEAVRGELELAIKPKIRFLLEVTRLIVDHSYLEMIQRILPDSMHRLMPANTQPINKYQLAAAATGSNTQSRPIVKKKEKSEDDDDDDDVSDNEAMQQEEQQEDSEQQVRLFDLVRQVQTMITEGGRNSSAPIMQLLDSEFDAEEEDDKTGGGGVALRPALYKHVEKRSLDLFFTLLFFRCGTRTISHAFQYLGQQSEHIQALLLARSTNSSRRRKSKMRRSDCAMDGGDDDAAATNDDDDDDGDAMDDEMDGDDEMEDRQHVHACVCALRCLHATMPSQQQFREVLVKRMLESELMSGRAVIEWALYVPDTPRAHTRGGEAEADEEADEEEEERQLIKRVMSFSTWNIIRFALSQAEREEKECRDKIVTQDRITGSRHAVSILLHDGGGDGDDVIDAYDNDDDDEAEEQEQDGNTNEDLDERASDATTKKMRRRKLEMRTHVRQRLGDDVAKLRVNYRIAKRKLLSLYAVLVRKSIRILNMSSDATCHAGDGNGNADANMKSSSSSPRQQRIDECCEWLLGRLQDLFISIELPHCATVKFIDKLFDRAIKVWAKKDGKEPPEVLLVMYEQFRAVIAGSELRHHHKLEVEQYGERDEEHDGQEAEEEEEGESDAEHNMEHTEEETEEPPQNDIML